MRYRYRFFSIGLLLVSLTACSTAPSKIDPNYQAYLNTIKTRPQQKIVEIVAQDNRTIELKGVKEFVVYAPNGAGSGVAVYRPQPNPATVIAHDVVHTLGLGLLTTLPTYWGWKYGSSIVKTGYSAISDVSKTGLTSVQNTAQTGMTSLQNTAQSGFTATQNLGQYGFTALQNLGQSGFTANSQTAQSGFSNLGTKYTITGDYLQSGDKVQGDKVGGDKNSYTTTSTFDNSTNNTMTLGH